MVLRRVFMAGWDGDLAEARAEGEEKGAAAGADRGGARGAPPTSGADGSPEHRERVPSGEFGVAVDALLDEADGAGDGLVHPRSLGVEAGEGGAAGQVAAAGAEGAEEIRAGDGGPGPAAGVEFSLAAVVAQLGAEETGQVRVVEIHGGSGGVRARVRFVVRGAIPRRNGSATQRP